MKNFSIKLVFLMSFIVMLVSTVTAQTPILVSAANAGAATGNDASTLYDFSNSFKSRSVSDDGRYVVFTSRAGNLSPVNDTNNFNDVFVRDLTTGTTRMVSVNSAGNGGGNNNSGGASISSDGRFVVFVSQATNLVAVSDANGTNFDVFIRDLSAGTTRLVSVNVSGNATAGEGSLFPVINADGRFVAFESFATDLSNTPDNPGSNDVFVRDVTGGITVQASVSTTGASADTNSAQAVLSADGRTVAFQTNANLTPNDTNGRQDIYVRNLTAGTTTLASASFGGAASNGSGSFNPSLSADGRLVAFTSSATNLVSNTTGNVNNVFVRDLQTGSTVLASVNTAGTNGGNSGSGSPVISANGRVVAFQSAASNLTTTTDGNELSDIFARDLQTNTTRLISVNQSGTGSGNRFSGDPNVNADGSVITFKSLATDLVNVADNNNDYDVFVRNVTTGTTRLASVNTAGTATGNLQSGNFRPIYPAISANGQTIAFDSLASDLAANDNNATYDVFAFRPAATIVKTAFDFDGDGKADQSVFRNGVWYLNQSASGFAGVSFGFGTDNIVPADFDGDGKTDIAVFRSGVWYWLGSSNGGFQAVQFGQAGDIPVPFDYTGDGRAELAVYRSGVWYILNLAGNQFQAVQFGIASDKPVAADYDGDGKTDIAVVRQGGGTSSWYILGTSRGFYGLQFGTDTDKLVPADYDGDGRADVAVFRSGFWYILGSTQGFSGVQFGTAGDVPVASDYDGDGRADIAVFRNGIWYLMRSQQGFGAVQFGTTGDKPIPAAFAP